jgi:hypothetical protein
VHCMEPRRAVCRGTSRMNSGVSLDDLRLAAVGEPVQAAQACTSLLHLEGVPQVPRLPNVFMGEMCKVRHVGGGGANASMCQGVAYRGWKWI